MPRSSVPKVLRKRNSVGKPKIVVPVTRPESEVRIRPPSPLEVVTPNSKPTNAAKRVFK